MAKKTKVNTIKERITITRLVIRFMTKVTGKTKVTKVDCMCNLRVVINVTNNLGNMYIKAMMDKLLKEMESIDTDVKKIKNQILIIIQLVVSCSTFLKHLE